MSNIKYSDAETPAAYVQTPSSQGIRLTLVHHFDLGIRAIRPPGDIASKRGSHDIYIYIYDSI